MAKLMTKNAESEVGDGAVEDGVFVGADDEQCEEEEGGQDGFDVVGG